MENTKPNNPVTDNYSDIQRNMTLRDYFAGLAMQGIANNIVSTTGVGNSWEHIAKTSYLIADAMLKQREINL